MHVSEWYIAKSDPYIVMVSTLNAPGSLFYPIEQEPKDTFLYEIEDLSFGLTDMIGHSVTC